jgi:hypothetical protein
MKIVVTFTGAPIPVRSFDWVAHFDGGEEDGPCGYGPTKLSALYDLRDALENDAEAAAVQREIDAILDGVGSLTI